MADRETDRLAEIKQWTRVEVTDESGQVVAIEDAMLAGRDIGEREQEAIIDAIRTLCGFIGLPDPVDTRARVAALEAELSRIQQLARCFRLEDLLDNPSETSETVRVLRAFEVAATLRRQLVKAEAERDARLTPAQARERIESLNAPAYLERHTEPFQSGYVAALTDVLALFPDQEPTPDAR